MKNTKNTNKYILALQAALLVVVFLIARPLSAAADDIGYDNTGTGYDNTDIGYDNPDIGYDNPDIGYNYPTNGYVSNGGYYGGYAGYVPSYNYNVNSTVTTGGFSGGTLTVVPPTTYVSNGSVTSGGFYGGTYYNNGTNGPLLTGSCYASVNSYQVGATVTWSVTVNGGNGNYQYSWTGDEGLSSTGQTVLKTYAYAGTKNATVNVTSSDGQSFSRTCSVNVGPSVVPNQVLAYSDNATPLTGVYLSDVPYTGAGDVVRMISFILGLVAWSALLAYYFMKRKYNVNIFARANAEVAPAHVDAHVSNAFANKIASDTQEISFVEEYARMKKVILSSDATVKLVKLQKLGQGSAIETIDQLATKDWVAVGENDIKTL